MEEVRNRPYRGRKKYKAAEAKDQISIALASIGNCRETILSYSVEKPDRALQLICSLCNQTPDEIIRDNQEKILYLQNKVAYMRQFL